MSISLSRFAGSVGTLTFELMMSGCVDVREVEKCQMQREEERNLRVVGFEMLVGRVCVATLQMIVLGN